MPDFADLRTRRSATDTGSITGTVLTAPVSNVCTVDIGTAQIAVNIVRGLTPAVGDIVLVQRQGSARWLINILYATAPAAPAVPNDPPPPAVPVTQTGTSVFKPTSTGTYRAGKWRTDTSDLYQGLYAYSNFGENHGAAFYGSGPGSLSGATCTRVTVRLKRLVAGDYAGRTPTLRLLQQKTRPAGTVTILTSQTGPSMAVNTSTTFTLPNTWGQSLIDGTAGGIGIDLAGGSSPYVVMAGKASWSGAFVLSISWKRTT